MANRVNVSPSLLRWARQRSGRSLSALKKSLPRYAEWEAGKTQPTWRQLEHVAQKTYTPLGYFFLLEPPVETLPIPDFRTVSNEGIATPSPNLLDTLQTMQRRQEWLRETLLEEGAEPLPFVGSVDLKDDPVSIAREMRATVGLDDDWAGRIATWRDAVGELRRKIELIGIMAVINGVVGNNTHRKLSVEEFRGFALCDPHAPLVFVNGADAESAKLFTLAHELAHVWLGRGGISGFDALMPGDNEVEQFCNKTAAEFLVPARDMRTLWAEVRRAGDPFQVIARRFKVSPIVAARRALDLKLIDREAFFTFYHDYMAQELKSRKASGGDFYNNQNTRVGERFAAEIVRAAKEGRLLYRDAYLLTGLSGNTFEKYARHIGFDF